MQSENWTNNRTLALVRGYHRCSELPAMARSLSFLERFAIILDTYRPDVGEMVFDAELFTLLLLETAEILSAEQIDARFGDQTRSLTVASFATFYQHDEKIDPEPPESIVLRHRTETVAVIATELWYQVGGPAPYHDSYTFSIYTPEDKSAQFRRALWDCAIEAGARVRLYEEALPRSE